MICIPGYSLLETVLDNHQSKIYRGITVPETKKVLLRIDQHSDTGLAAASFSHELAIAGKLNLPRICRPLKLAYCGTIPVLVMEDPGGMFLQQYMEGRHLSIEQFLIIARRLAAAVGSLHRGNVSHRNLNPANILIDPYTHEVSITGFSAAAAVSGKSPAPDLPFAGNVPAYMSPEQTALLGRVVDYRTDFYSLGIIFFELLTGRLPFPETDPARLVHAHLAKKPPSLRRFKPAVPPPLAAVVQKLLSKSPGERYQSARVLVADLNRCRREWRRAGQICKFSLGRNDIPAVMQLPSKLYGRDSELALLKKSYNLIKRGRIGRTGIVLVSGFAGCGKTALVNHFFTALGGRTGVYCIEGKSEQLHRDRPYISFIQAFRRLVQQILSEDKKNLVQWRHLLLRNLGAGGAVLTRILPEIEMVTGPLPPVEKVSPMEEKNRFLLAVRNFLRTFAEKGCPLVIFLDDLQWADDASLELIRYLALGPKDCSLLIIGAYRDNEVTGEHSLAAVIGRLKQSGALLREIHLAELDREQTAKLVADTLHSSMVRTEPLARTLYQKTGGNPFFLLQLLQTLDNRRVLFFNLNRWRWDWDLETLCKLPYSEEVLDFLEDKLTRLDPETLAVLKMAACWGDSFSPDLLASAGEHRLVQVQNRLRQAQNNNLVLEDRDGCSNFVHDRIRQAVYSLIPAEEKKMLHLQLGRLLVEGNPEEHLETRIMEIAYHLNMAAERIASMEERLRLAEYNLLAGRKAKSSAAYESARRYLQAGLALLPDRSPNEYHALRQAFFVEMTPCEYMCGNHVGAQEMLNTALSRAKTPLEKADLYMLKNILHTGLGEHFEAVTAGLAGLKEMGIDLSLEPSLPSLLYEFLRAGWLVRRLASGKRAIPPERVKPGQLKGMDLLMALFASSYHLPTLFYPLLVLKMVELSLKYPNSKYSPLAVGSYALVAAHMLGINKTVYRLGKDAADLLELINLPSIRGRYIYAFTFFINHWAAHKKTSLEYLNKVFDDALASGDLFYAGFALSGLVEIKYYCGFPLSKIVEDCRRHLDWMRAHNLEGATDFLIAFKRLVQSLQGEAGGSDFGASVSREADAVSFGTNRSYFISAIQWFYLMGNYREGLRLADVIAGNIESVAREPSYVEYCFYHALCITASWTGLTVRQRQRYRKNLRKYRSHFRRWARLGPENFDHRRLLLEAEATRLWGQSDRAMQLYEEAVHAAGENGYPQDKALANLLAAEYCTGRNMDGLAAFFLDQACRGFASWGARAVVRRLREKYDFADIDSSRESPGQAAETAAAVGEGIKYGPAGVLMAYSMAETAYAGDLAALIKASHSLIEENGWQELAGRLMRILCENAGARCGALITTRGAELYMEVAVREETGEFAGLPPTLLAKQKYIPRAIVQYVSRTGETLLLDDACKEGPFWHHPDVVGKKLRSVCCFCVPVRNKAPSILFLENNLIAGAFKQERLKIVQLIAAQIAFVADLIRPVKEPTGLYGLPQQKQPLLPESLTPRETEVLNLLASGLTNREIAAQLGLTLSTVKSHIQNIYGKLGVDRRLRAVAQAKEMDLLR